MLNNTVITEINGKPENKVNPHNIISEAYKRTCNVLQKIGGPGCDDKDTVFSEHRTQNQFVPNVLADSKAKPTSNLRPTSNWRQSVRNRLELLTIKANEPNDKNSTNCTPTELLSSSDDDSDTESDLDSFDECSSSESVVYTYNRKSFFCVTN